jgi:hypothetical protein
VRRKELLDVVTLFAAILIGCGSELTPVDVVMATTALCLGYSKHGVFALGRVALLAFHSDMAAFERVGSRGMLFDSKGGGLEPAHVVTACALRAAGARHELAVVVVGMTIHTVRKRHWRFEVAARMAVAASDAAVLAKKRIRCPGVIEALQLCYARPA